MQIAKKAGYGRIAALCSRLLERHGLYLSKNAAIGEHIRLPHPSAIVIGDGVTIGDKVTIYQSVTLGGRVAGDWKQGNYPTISDGCTLFAGVVVVGKVYIGKNCVIGANSVVLSDIPDNAVAVGAPARVVSIRAASLKE
ncbi:serine acetyltransferase [Sulfitobacter sp. Ks41]|uniref:serine O-acetyltransferase n=1 Tax=Sulfitobacter sp. Ks41 TaxID=2731139 RepID=UPI0023E20DF2|nr:serine acetyltransferase [Sulfitobacter sp. Ks41]